MSLFLTSRQIAALNQLQTTVLAPLAYGSLEEWTHHVLVDLENLVDGAPGSRAVVPEPGRAQWRRQWVEAVLDQLDVALLVLDYEGHEEFRSVALETQLLRDQESERVMAEMRAAAAEVLEMLRARETSHWIARTGRRGFTTSRCGYEVLATPWPTGLHNPQYAVAVQLRWRADALPDVSALMQQLQLTRREAEVTRLLALGFSNDRIARELGISRHTVRHHCEWVFLKLGVHTRKALALEIGRRLGCDWDVHPIPGS